jgi:hypothetical protein
MTARISTFRLALATAAVALGAAATPAAAEYGYGIGGVRLIPVAPLGSGGGYTIPTFQGPAFGMGAQPPLGRLAVDTGGRRMGSMYPFGSVPTAGINAPTLGAANSRGKPTGRGTPLREETAPRKDAADRVETAMENRPLRSATVVRLEKGGIVVRTGRGGEERTVTVPADEVFFFPADGRLEAASQAAGKVKAGDAVLVLDPR